jgi:hypothetical protein
VFAVIDLTHRQAARVLEQALRGGARVEIEPRNRDATLVGHLCDRERDILRVSLQDLGQDWPLTGLIGAFCDVRAALLGEQYQFCTCVVDALHEPPRQELLLAVPDVLQVLNRRRFDRKVLREQLLVQIWPNEADAPLLGTLVDIGLAGLGCELPRREAEEQLLIDEPTRVQFQIPGATELLNLPAVVCVKTATPEGQYLHVGVEFLVPESGDPAEAMLARLRNVLSQDYSGPAQAGGEQ